MSAESEFERAGDLAGATVRPAGDGEIVEIAHGGGSYSRFAADAACRISAGDGETGGAPVVVDLDHGDAWLVAAEGGPVVEARRHGAAVVVAGGAAAVKGDADGRTIVVGVEGDVIVRPSSGDEVALRSQAAMLDRTGVVGQVVDVAPEQIASEPWVARNRALAPLAVPPAVPEPVADEPEPEPEAAEESVEPEPEAVEESVEPEPEAVEDEPVPVADEPEPVAEEADEVEPEADEAVEPVAEEAVEPEADEVEPDELESVGEATEPASEDVVGPEAGDEPEPGEPATVVFDPAPEPAPDPAPVWAATDVIDIPADAPAIDDELAPRRRWPRLVIAGVLLVAAIALLLPRVSPDGDDESEVSSATVTSVASQSTTSPAPPEAGGDPATSATEAPDTTETGGTTDPEGTTDTTEAELPRSDAPFENQLVACRRSGGQVTFAGRLTNHETDDKSYRLHVIFTGAGGAVVERRQLELDVPSGETEAWQVTSAAGSRLQGGSCDLERVEPLG